MPNEQNGHNFRNGIFICIFCEWKLSYFIQILLKSVPNGQQVNTDSSNGIKPDRRNTTVCNLTQLHDDK